MYELKTRDEWKYTSFFYCEEYNEAVQEVLLSLGLEVLEVNLVDDLDYQFKINELVNYPDIMN